MIIRHHNRLLFTKLWLNLKKTLSIISNVRRFNILSLKLKKHYTLLVFCRIVWSDKIQEKGTIIFFILSWLVPLKTKGVSKSMLI